MYILMISRGYPTSSDPQWGCFEKDQAEALAEYGHKVVVMSVDARYEKNRGKLGLHHFEKNGVCYYNYVMFPGFIFSKTLGVDYYRKHIKFHYYNKLYKRIVIDHGIADVIYSQFFFNTMAGVQLKEKYGVPVVGIEHLARFNDDTLTKETEIGASFAYSRVDALIAVSESLAKSLEKWFGKQSYVVHNMYGSEFVYKTDNVKKASSPLVFVSAASLVYRKGFDMLIRSFAQSELSKDSWILNIIGWGEERKNLEIIVKDNGLQRNVFFLGKMDKEGIAKELRKSDVYVLPSRNENFSVAILEGLATGLPILATDCGGIRECINESNGIIVPVDDVGAMADAIREIVNTYPKYDKKKIAKDCKERFSPQAIAAKLTDVFESVI